MEVTVSTKCINLLKKHNIDYDPTVFNQRKSNDIVLEAKRVILSEQVDRIVNNEIYNMCNNPTGNVLRPPTLDEFDTRSVYAMLHADFVTNLEVIRAKHGAASLQRKYFDLWRKRAKDKKRTREIISDQQIDEFINALKRRQRNKQHNSKTQSNDENVENKDVKTPNVKKKFNRQVEKTKQQNSTTKKSELSEDSKVEGVKFKRQLKVQRQIMLQQREKLLEQQHVIAELKYGQVSAELHEALKETRDELRTMTTLVSSQMNKAKVGALSNAISNKLNVAAQGAPKLVRAMEQRAMARAERREMNKERRRVIDEERQRKAEEALERKRAADEEEKRLNLLAIKERRRRELAVAKAAQQRKQRYYDDCVRADRWYRRSLKAMLLRLLKRLVTVCKEEMYKCDCYYEMVIQRKCLMRWIVQVQRAKRARDDKALACCRRIVLRRAFNALKEVILERRRNEQVAEDYAAMKLLANTMLHFHVQVCSEKMRRYRLYIKAMQHYKGRLLVQCFYQWRCLPAVVRLEKAKEEKKRRWREKVMEILPDYRPPVDDYY